MCVLIISYKKKKKKKSGMELWQWHCRIPFHFSQFQKFFLPPISAMSLPQLPKIYTLYFGNAIAANYFFFPPIFGNGIATIANFFFFPIIWFSLRTLTLWAPTRAVGMGRRNCGNTIAENQKFLSPTFYLSLSNFCWISAMILPQFTLFPQIAK